MGEATSPADSVLALAVASLMPPLAIEAEPPLDQPPGIVPEPLTRTEPLDTEPGSDAEAMMVIPNWKSISNGVMIDASGQNLILYFTNNEADGNLSEDTAVSIAVGQTDDAARDLCASAGDIVVELKPHSDFAAETPPMPLVHLPVEDQNPVDAMTTTDAVASGAEEPPAELSIAGKKDAPTQLTSEHSYSSVPNRMASKEPRSNRMLRERKITPKWGTCNRYLRSKKKLLTCEKCGQSFSDKESLQEHNEAHHMAELSSSENFPCHQCGKVFQKRPLLHQHIRNTHTMERPHACMKCGKTFKLKPQLKEHLLVHTKEKPFTCKHCGIHFRWRYQLADHVPTHGNQEEGPYKCSECGTSFFTKWKYQNHLLSHSTERPHVCPICSKTFKRKEGLRNHQVIHSSERRFVCQQCGSAFKSHQSFNSHKRVHLAEKPHQCPTCGKGFRTKSNLKQHRQSHTGEKPFVCEYCGRAYRGRCAFNNHLLAHEVEKVPHACVTCGARFGTEHELAAHAGAHAEGLVPELPESPNGLNPGLAKFFTCVQCVKVFSTRAKLDRHCRSAHPTEMPFACQDCGSAFKNMRELSYHRLVHLQERAFGCSECGKRFKTSSVLREHLKIHGTETPFQCHKCSKAFKKKIQLTQHLVSHSDAKMHACDLCGQTFKYKSGVRTHRQLKHGQHTIRNITGQPLLH